MSWTETTDFPGAELHDGDAGRVGDGEDLLAVVGDAAAEVAYAAGVADADLSAFRPAWVCGS